MGHLRSEFSTIKPMKINLLVLVILTACASAPKLRPNTANFVETPKELKDKLKGYGPMSVPQATDGHKISVEACSFLRTMYLELTPVQTGNFAQALMRRIEPNTILGLRVTKTPNNMNPCSRLRLYTSMEDITEQGSKKVFDEKGLLAKGTLGVKDTGEAYLVLMFFEKQKPDKPVRVANPGVFLSVKKAEDMTDDELAEWLVATLYTNGWK